MATSALGHGLGHTNPSRPSQSQSLTGVWVVCTTAPMAVGHLNCDHSLAGRDGSWPVFGWLPFLLSAHFLQFFADDLSGSALDHSPPSELFAHATHLPEEGTVAAEASLVVHALLEDITAETFERLFRNTAGNRSLGRSKPLLFGHWIEESGLLCSAPQTVSDLICRL